MSVRCRICDAGSERVCFNVRGKPRTQSIHCPTRAWERVVKLTGTFRATDARQYKDKAIADPRDFYFGIGLTAGRAHVQNTKRITERGTSETKADRIANQYPPGENPRAKPEGSFGWAVISCCACLQTTTIGKHFGMGGGFGKAWFLLRIARDATADDVRISVTHPWIHY